MFKIRDHYESIILVLCVVILLLNVTDKRRQEFYCTSDSQCRKGQRCQKPSVGGGDGFCV